LSIFFSIYCLFRAPFHPKRLLDFMESIFFVETVTYEDEEEEEEAGGDGEKKEENGEKKEENGKNGDAKSGDAKKEGKDENEMALGKVYYELFGNKTVEERDAAVAENMKTMKDNYGHIYRSKVSQFTVIVSSNYLSITQGFLWIAGRDEQSGEWSQAGTIGELSCGDLWLGLYPKEALPKEGTEEWKTMQNDMQVYTVETFNLIHQKNVNYSSAVSLHI